MSSQHSTFEIITGSFAIASGLIAIFMWMQKTTKKDLDAEVVRIKHETALLELAKVKGVNQGGGDVVQLYT